MHGKLCCISKFKDVALAKVATTTDPHPQLMKFAFTDFNSIRGMSHIKVAPPPLSYTTYFICVGQNAHC